MRRGFEDVELGFAVKMSGVKIMSAWIAGGEALNSTMTA
jgi:hypothetical protein